jgi:hypothetical protein
MLLIFLGYPSFFWCAELFGVDRYSPNKVLYFWFGAGNILCSWYEYYLLCIWYL